jgi:hypothetical protein
MVASRYCDPSRWVRHEPRRVSITASVNRPHASAVATVDRAAIHDDILTLAGEHKDVRPILPLCLECTGQLATPERHTTAASIEYNEAVRVGAHEAIVNDPINTCKLRSAW